MSVEAISWALNVPVGGNAKVVLLGLANHAHPDGTEAFPALDTLARYAHCDRSTARRNVRKLIDAGWIERDGTGPRGQSKFQLRLDREGWQNATGGVLPPGHECHPGGGTSTREGVAPAPPEPSFEPSSEPIDDEEEARESDHARVVDELAELLLAAARGRTTFEAIKDRERELRGAIAAYWDRKPDTDAVTDRWEEEQRRLSLAFGGWTVAEAEADDDERRRERTSPEQAAPPLEAAVA